MVDQGLEAPATWGAEEGQGGRNVSDLFMSSPSHTDTDEVAMTRSSCEDRRNPAWLWILLPVLLTFFFFPLVFQGYVLSQSDVLYFFPPWEASRPPTVQHPANSLLSDLSLQFYPFRAYAQSLLSQGEIPLWNPALLGGVPFLANMQSALFSPTTLVATLAGLWLPLEHTFGLSAWLRLCGAGLATYVFARRLALSAWAALLAGMVFMLCAFNVMWLNHPHTNVAIVLPVLLYGIEQTLARKPGACCLVALATSLTVCGGHPETAFHVFAAAGGYGLIRFGQDWQQTGTPHWSCVGSALAGLSWGLLAASVVLIPFAENFLYTGISAYRARLPQEAFFLPVSAVWTFVVPDIFGHPHAGEVGGPLNYNDRTGYIGLAPLLLVGALLPTLRRDARGQSFAVLAAGALLLAFGCPPLAELTSFVPIVRVMPHQRVLLVYEFAMAMLAGIAVEHLLKDTQTRLLVRLGWLSSGLFVGLIGFVGFIGLLGAPSLGSLASLDVGGPLSASARSGLCRAVLISAGVLGCLALARLRVVSRYGCVVGMCGLTGIDLVVFGFGYTPMVPHETVLTHAPPAVRYLQDQPGVFRIAGIGERGIFIPNTAMLYGLMDVRGYEPMVSSRVLHFFETALHGEVDIGGALFILPDTALSEQTLNFLSLLNVRYILSRNELSEFHASSEFSGRQLKKVYDADVKIYLNQAALPRAFIVHQAKQVTTGEAAFGLLVSGQLDVRRTVVIEGSEGGDPHELRLPKWEAAPAEGRLSIPEEDAEAAQIVHYSAHQIDLQVNLTEPGYLVLSDTYFPGWKAIVNGQETTLYQANYILRAVPLRRGQHQVSFVYEPFSFRLGLSLSCLAWASLLGAGGWTVIQRWRGTKSRKK